MTTEERREAFIAGTAALAAEFDAEGTLTVQVRSQTDPNLVYTLHARGALATCSCRGFNSTGHCKHQRALEAVLKEAHA